MRCGLVSIELWDPIFRKPYIDLSRHWEGTWFWLNVFGTQNRTASLIHELASNEILRQPKGYSTIQGQRDNETKIPIRVSQQKIKPRTSLKRWISGLNLGDRIIREYSDMILFRRPCKFFVRICLSIKNVSRSINFIRFFTTLSWEWDSRLLATFLKALSLSKPSMWLSFCSCSKTWINSLALRVLGVSTRIAPWRDFVGHNRACPAYTQ